MPDTDHIIQDTTDQTTGERLRRIFRQMRGTSTNQSCCDARITSIIIGAVICIVSVVFGIYCTGKFIYEGHEHKYNPIVGHLEFLASILNSFEGHGGIDVVLSMMIASSVIVSLLECSFSVVLATGAMKRKSGHVIAYFIYGVIRSISLFIFAIALYSLLDGKTTAHVTLALCGLSTALTAVAYKTYKNVIDYTMSNLL